MASDLTKITVNLIPRSVVALDDAVFTTGHSRTDTINRALQVYAFLMQETEVGGKTLMLSDPDGSLSRVKIL